MTDNFEPQHPAPRKRGRPKGSKNKQTGKKNVERNVERPDTTADRHAALEALDRMVLLMERLARSAQIWQAEEVRELASDVHSLADHLDDLLADLRRELHIALKTMVENDTSLPRDVVDVLEYLDGLGESLQEVADGIMDAVKEEGRLRTRAGGGNG